MPTFWSNALIDVLLIIYVINCLFMGLVIMMQRSKQEGLGAAFGGSITEGIWGAQTSSVLVKATVWSAIIFFGLSIVLARLYSTQAAHSALPSTGQQLIEQSAPAVTPTTNNVTPTGAPANAVPAHSTVPSANATTNAAPVVSTTPVAVPAATTAPKPATAPSKK